MTTFCAFLTDSNTFSKRRNYYRIEILHSQKPMEFGEQLSGRIESSFYKPSAMKP
jgi:hypothetical protein